MRRKWATAILLEIRQRYGIDLNSSPSLDRKMASTVEPHGNSGIILIGASHIWTELPSFK
jgi:S-adenosylmethionine/arginine decarboxylase-like enzyme